jgi:hypothetical protein
LFFFVFPDANYFPHDLIADLEQALKAV